MQENLIVFSNEYFEEQWEQFYNNETEPTQLYLMNFPEETRREAGRILQQYADMYGIEDETQKGVQNFPQAHFYDTAKIIETVQKNLLFYLSCGVIVGLDLFLCSIFISPFSEKCSHCSLPKFWCIFIHFLIFHAN